MSTQAAPIHEDQPRPGWYKLRYQRDAKWKPVAIWRNAAGKLVAKVGSDDADPDRIWTWCADNKVTKEAAKFAFDKGYWPDEPPPIGHNAPPSDDPFEALKADADAKQKQAEDWLAKRPTITTQNDADYAVNAQRELAALNKRADALFEAEKKPIRDQAKEIDEKFRFRSVIAAVADKLSKVAGRFMAAEEARQKTEAVAKFKEEQARIAAERAKLEAAAKRKMEDDPVAALTEDQPPLPELPLGPEPVRIQAGGGVGRKAGLRDNWVAVITDYPAALAHFSEHPDLKEIVQKLATHVVRDAKGSIKVPGVENRNDRKPA